MNVFENGPKLGEDILIKKSALEQEKEIIEICKKDVLISKVGSKRKSNIEEEHENVWGGAGLDSI